MIRIVGLQRQQNSDQEFVLLQNQGSLRTSLRGHVVVSEGAFLSGEVGEAVHSFTQDITVAPGQYIVLYTGFGTSRWVRTKDSMMVYHCYMGRNAGVWINTILPLHVLGIQHSYQERTEPALLLR